MSPPVPKEQCLLIRSSLVSAFMEQASGSVTLPAR